MFVLTAAAVLPAAAGAAVAPTTIDFGTVTSDHVAAVTVTNDSGEDWLMGTPSFESGGSAFSVTGTDCVFLFTHPPVDSCTVTIQLNGQSLPPGVYSDTLDVPHVGTGNVTTIETVSVQGVVGEHDFTPPSVPQNLHATGITPTGATLTWSASTDDESLAGYRLLEWDGSAWSNYALTSGTSYVISTLDPGSTQTFAVAAVDSAGNVSDPSAAVVVTTPVPPPTPQNVSAVPALNSVTFSWDAPAEGDSTFNFLVQRQNGGLWQSQAVVQAPATGVTVSGLTPHTSYNFRVMAEDADGLLSAPVLVSAATLADTTAPTAPVVTAHATTSAGTRLQWTASIDDVAVAGYQVSMFEDGAWVSLDDPLPANATGYTVTGLLPNTAYTFGVAAFDGSGNASTRTSIEVTTGHAPRFTQLPRVAFVAGSTVTRSLVPTRVSWATEAATRCKTEVGRSVGSGWDATTLGNPQTATYDWKLGYNASRSARVQVTDCAGTPSGWAQTPAFAPTPVAASAIAFGSGWGIARNDAYLGGSERFNAHAGAAVTVKLKNARAVAVVGSCGTARGSARVYLDGALSATVSDRCSGGTGRVLYTHRWATPGAHTLKLVVVGPKRVDVDGFITI